jgi:hypothetical protein|tara:strand:- start:255 stop:407 length:153 start_codon:yes stop_codon:yes gene_type:complete
VSESRVHIALDNGFQILETLEIIFSKGKEEQGREVFANRVFCKELSMLGY